MPGSRNAARICSEVWQNAEAWLCLRWNPEQIPSQLPLSHETIYQKLYADRGYDHDKYCRPLHVARISASLARRGELYGGKLGKIFWVVERTHA